jgi:hypothetical protein
MAGSAAAEPACGVSNRSYPLIHPAVSRTLALVARKTGQLWPAAWALSDMILEQATLKA